MLQFRTVVQKASRRATAHLSRLNQTVCWVTEPLWSGHGVDRVHRFKFHGGLRESEIADKRYDGLADRLVSVWKSVPSPAVLASVSVTKINGRRYTPDTVQWNWVSAAAVWLDRTRHWTREQLNSAWEVAMTDSADMQRPVIARHKRRCRRQATHDLDFQGSYRGISVPSRSSSVKGCGSQHEVYCSLT